MISYAATVLKNFVQFLVDNREILSSFGMKAAKVYLMVKALGMVITIGRAIIAYIQAAAAIVDSSTLASQRAVEAAEAKKRAEILATEKLREAARRCAKRKTLFPLDRRAAHRRNSSVIFQRLLPKRQIAIAS